MAWADIRFWSTPIEKCTGMNVILPMYWEGDGPFPVYYLLHGLSDDYSIWHRRTCIEFYAGGYPLIIVMPDAARSFYCDMVEGPPYERHIIEEVIPMVDRYFPTIAERRGRVIGGLSMGGYGALKLALKHPDLFCSVNGQSGCYRVVKDLIDHGEWPGYPQLTPELRRIFGQNPSLDNDPFTLAQQVAPAQRPAIRLDCGTEDPLIQQSRDFHAHLEQLGVDHEYQEYPGTHDWFYWEAHLRETLAFHARVLDISYREQ
jgi:S-formylglutathione hydrolase FrmB